MANIFRQQNNLESKPKRNVFDLSYLNNLTFQAGCITPLLCEETIPGDSFKIDMSVGIKLMPTKFPCQTPMDFVIHVYKIPMRTLWDDFEEYYFRMKDVTAPYLSIPAARAHELATGSLADYLGVPTTLVHQSTSFLNLRAPEYHGSDVVTTVITQTNPPVSDPEQVVKYSFDEMAKVPLADNSTTPAALREKHNNAYLVGYNSLDQVYHPEATYDWNQWQVANYSDWPYSYSTLGFLNFYGFNFPDIIPCGTFITNRKFTTNIVNYTPSVPAQKTYLFVWKQHGTSEKFSDSIHEKSYEVAIDPAGQYIQMTVNDLADLNKRLETHSVWVSLVSQYFSGCDVDRNSSEFCGVVGGMIIETRGNNVTDASEVSSVDGVNPFIDYGSGPKIPLNALPFRAYEAVFNAYYRNERINPFKIGGVPEYNKYIPVRTGGADTYSYQLHYRNWEDDYFTSCLDSPQQGIAPLVGVSANGTFHFKDQNNVEYTMQTQVDADGRLSGINSYSDDLPIGNVHRMQELITYGISINDFRNVNSFQRWLEKNIRIGYKFRDQIRSHFGVTPKYDTLQMPEFVGGCRFPVQMEQVTNLAQSEDAALGDFAGQGYAAGTNKHSVHVYTDEPCIIMAVGMLVPHPCYSQTVKKLLVKRDSFDYYFDEFANIGYQPVFNYELTPLQASLEDQQESSNTLFDVFGYQRPWADYIARYDEVHGQFRTTLHPFVLQRTFDVTPQLGKSFITIDPLSVNNIFADDNAVYDKIIGQVRFKMTAKRPIPRFGVPKLE